MRSLKSKQQQIESQRRRRRNDPEKYREINRRSERKRKIREYGLSVEKYEHILFVQNNCCAICKEPNRLKRDFHIDHDHETNKVRGILCHSCNLMLGHAKDKVSILRAGIEYLVLS